MEISINHHGSKGVFVLTKYKTDDKIIQFKGQIVLANEVPHCNDEEEDKYIQIGIGKYIGPSGDLDDYINHSCEPNCYLKWVEGELWLFALEDIDKGKELTWDYETFIWSDETWTMNCYCGSNKCRRIIKYRDK